LRQAETAQNTPLGPNAPDPFARWRSDPRLAGMLPDASMTQFLTPASIQRVMEKVSTGRNQKLIFSYQKEADGIHQRIMDPTTGQLVNDSVIGQPPAPTGRTQSQAQRLNSVMNTVMKAAPPGYGYHIASITPDNVVTLRAAHPWLYHDITTRVPGAYELSPDLVQGKGAPVSAAPGGSAPALSDAENAVVQKALGKPNPAGATVPVSAPAAPAAQTPAATPSPTATPAATPSPVATPAPAAAPPGTLAGGGRLVLKPATYPDGRRAYNPKTGDYLFTDAKGNFYAGKTAADARPIAPGGA
jgi:hypothetical protein